MGEILEYRKAEAGRCNWGCLSLVFSLLQLAFLGVFLIAFYAHLLRREYESYLMIGGAVLMAVLGTITGALGLRCRGDEHTFWLRRDGV